MNIQDRQTEVFNKYGVFFAFSNEQLTEGVNKLKKEGVLLEGEKITRSNFIGGMFYPSKFSKEFLKDLSEAHKQGQSDEKKEFDGLTPAKRKKFIINVLYNYECFYTGDYSEAYNNELKFLGATIEEIKSVYYKELPNTD